MARISLTTDQTDYLLEEMRKVEIGAQNYVDYTGAKTVYGTRIDAEAAFARAIKQHSLAREIIAKLNGAKMQGK